MSEQSRRSWMVTIGQTAVGVGLLSRVDAAATAPDQLPPGLYLPSTDHLGHALMSAEQFHPVVPGCPTDYIQPPTGPFHPEFFSEAEFAVVRRITALLLGEPPAEAAQEIAQWIDLRVASANGAREAAHRISPLYRSLAIAYMGQDRVKALETADPASVCRDGLAWLSHESENFVALATEQQLALLDKISDARPDKQVQNAGTRFFDLMKAETIRAFYTSRAGLRELDYKGNAFYARSPGCVHAKA